MSCAMRSRRSSTSWRPTSTREDPKRDARTMFGVLLDGIHDIVVGRVADTSEHARYLHHFCTRGVGGGE